MLTDEFGREVTGVRISLTDRCNFDCIYCHNEGLGDTRGPMDPQDAEMSTDDVVRFLEVVTEFDVDAVKFTGGEPMLRQDLAEIIARTPDELEVSLTTNGTFLPGRAEDLVDAGLERVNVSQDALDAEDFAAVTQSGAYERVLEGVDAALDAGLDPIKLNMVVFEHTAGYIPEMVDHVAENDGLQLQLIEYMPELTGRPEWNIDIERVHDWLAEQADEIEHREMHNRRRYWIGESDSSDDPNAGRGMVEIVDPVENATFCQNCHRVRVTHEGYLKGCLNRNDDLRTMGEMTKPEIRETFRETVENRVPYYGEYMIENGDGEWEIDEKYIEKSVQV
ncbi:GTP 3',8-cyclase MoaA [Natronobacterium gregoryi]|uniref:Probable GTP 3',8-cyclase n=2 Tax=Natronobacterium gregoryi TaxID=44930 RepID=L0ALC5_NATGS|nr:GTP 3',8-cyclase MoaA [Natronobacterium gregoryi]AFZ73855.1 putative molybdenum cofactor biosynthesis protein A, archaeal [Natronobacterium gregoryi SP2]ELY65101.1 molybdenum cofactor biosynthesis protein A [Natronobacterium gregoryi SP2]PLK19690.1 GTP 3',8-cyclase MoaA [Natronobacterium gregoryi SP2]SFJ42588.1 cyclic pyranopterin phosphate synthase [Natronobacterium gregoryi]